LKYEQYYSAFVYNGCMGNWLARLKRAWNVYRHIAAARGLLQWAGWWESATAALAGATVAIGSAIENLPWPLTVTAAFGTFAFASVIWRVFFGKTITPSPTMGGFAGSLETTLIRGSAATPIPALDLRSELPEHRPKVAPTRYGEAPRGCIPVAWEGLYVDNRAVSRLSLIGHTKWGSILITCSLCC
jgi:hypothetical protein